MFIEGKIISIKTITWILETSPQDSAPQSQFENKLKIIVRFLCHCYTHKNSPLPKMKVVLFQLFPATFLPADCVCRKACCWTRLLWYQSTLDLMDFPSRACDLYLYLSVKPEWLMLDLCEPNDKTVVWVLSCWQLGGGNEAGSWHGSSINRISQEWLY